ncbi:LINE-1 type transposase domain-containing protein 1 [Ochotona princeps]|uniref:LINE-1 type transposase domain-containing protein 1 n=1 Tax=Ochotona princeps TaxID=9978 RepID=UPI002715344C|nr:LINE-1 type transposase domain-containing protein 1 [Ochotona princeps]
MDEVKSKLDKVKQHGSRCKKLQGYKVSESDAGSRCRNYNIRTKDEEKESTNSEGVEEEGNMQTFRNEKILTASREEKVCDEGAILTLTADLSSATLGINRQWGNIFKILTDNDFEPKFLCDVKLSLKCDGETKTFSNLESLREFTSQKPFMKELLQGVLPQDEEKIYRGRRYGIQEKLRKGLIGSKHGTGKPTNDGLSFLFIKEVKIDKPEASSELEEEEEEQDASWIEEEEWEDASWLDTVRTSGLKKTEKYRILKLEELTAKEADLIQETEENFRKNVIHFFREIQEEIGNVKSFYPEILEIKNSIHDLDNVMDTLEERMDSLEDQILEFSKDAMQMAKQMINEERSRDTEDRSRSANIRLIGVPEKDNKDNIADDIVREVIEENFPELKKESRFEIISAHRIPSRIDENRLTPRHILVRFWNASDKEKIMIASKGKKEITHRGARIRLTADLSLSTLDARSKWAKIIEVLHEKGFRPRILYPAKLAFDFQGRTKMFYDIEEFRAFISSVPPLKKLLENVLGYTE